MKNKFFIISSKGNKLDTKIMLKLIGIYLKINDTQSIQEIYDFSIKFGNLNILHLLSFSPEFPW
ncbi:hypothetical protein [Clostridium pasteurianum]|uniref:hypothetical protein n=1 Tax=Clostridium pasteurianum TaxID=1501 RepID=UPI000825C507|nr:hypothetical protein [Clostridium pasteurianum]PJI10025.1 hypothetical protein CUB90_20075 [Clostridium sp. CT7]